MTFLTGLALRRRSVTVLLMIMVLAGGLLTYRSLPVELFPEIEFPLITVSAFYPSANPDAVVRDVTAPIERAISGVDGVQNIQSISTEDRSIVLANFKFGIDMAEAERSILTGVGSIPFPDAVQEPVVGRINPDAFPVLQLSVLGDRHLPEIQAIVDSRVLPAVAAVDGVFSADVVGAADTQIIVTVDPDRLMANGISMFQVSTALRGANVSVPAGVITQDGQTFPVRTSQAFGSIEEIRGLVVGFSGGPPEGGAEAGPVLLSDVADVALGAGRASSVSRTNGRPSLGITVIKDPDANTVDVTREVLDSLEALDGLPEDLEIVTISNDGPAIQAQVDTLQREALFGFLFAMAVVFAFLITFRPSLMRGLQLTARPTVVIGLSIPLSIFTGLLLMGANGMTLNLMTLGGLAISVGRVVDDSIVVLENVYRHIQRGEERLRAVLEATREVAPAIVASTLTTIVVFVPLVFIKGLVGEFFLPFALTVSFALAASLLVALTAVPVLGALLLRPGDISVDGDAAGPIGDRGTWMQRAYTPVLLWALRRKAVTLLGALLLTVGSLGLILLIPITLFPSGGDRFVVVDLALPPGASPDRVLAEVGRVEQVMERLTREGNAHVYQATVGSPQNPFAPGAGNIGGANVFVGLTEDAANDIAEALRAELAGGGDATISVSEVGSGGPPTSGLEMNVTGDDYAQISAVARQLVEEFGAIDGIVNVTTDVAEARDEIVITVDPAAAAVLGLTAGDVAAQVSQFMAGQRVTQTEVDGVAVDVFLRGRMEPNGGVETLRGLSVAGPLGVATLGGVAQMGFEKGPVSISRTDGHRSASITGSITEEDTRAIGVKVQEKVDAIGLPPGVEVTTGGIFQDIAEGFEAIFMAMGLGIILVYLVMVASLGALRNPFVIVMSLPLAVIGALAALAITGRTLGLPALMGMLLLIGIVVTNAIVLIAFVEQLRERGLNVHDALVQGGRVRLRPILMTAFTTSFALLPLAAFASDEGGVIGTELATVVIGGLASSTFLTLIVVPVVYTILHVSLPGLMAAIGARLRRSSPPEPVPAGDGD